MESTVNHGGEGEDSVQNKGSPMEKETINHSDPDGCKLTFTKVSREPTPELVITAGQ